MSATCYACKAPVLTVSFLHARSSEVRLVEPEPDPAGDVQIRRWAMGWDGRRSSPDAPPMTGWRKHRSHTCQPTEVTA